LLFENVLAAGLTFSPHRIAPSLTRRLAASRWICAADTRGTRHRRALKRQDSRRTAASALCSSSTQNGQRIRRPREQTMGKSAPHLFVFKTMSLVMPAKSAQGGPSPRPGAMWGENFLRASRTTTTRSTRRHRHWCCHWQPHPTQSHHFPDYRQPAARAFSHRSAGQLPCRSTAHRGSTATKLVLDSQRALILAGRGGLLRHCSQL
jgi:hypothetical protein